MDGKIKIVGFAGSLRHNSYNKSALKAASELLHEEATLEILDLADLPFFNQDLEDIGIPESVVSFKEKIASADAILISTPEYNYSIPPVLKNAIDWASRGKDFPLNGKPVAIMSASTGLFGGVRAQYHLRQVCVAVNLNPLNRPEVFIMTANKKIDEEGNLIDVNSRNAILVLLHAMVEKVKELKQINV